jgi:hypothetical protein
MSDLPMLSMIELLCAMPFELIAIHIQFEMCSSSFRLYLVQRIVFDSTPSAYLACS